MSEIAMYKALVSAGAPEEEARAAVADLARARDVVTKADLAELESRMVQMESRLIKWMAGVGLAIILTLVSVLLRLP